MKKAVFVLAPLTLAAIAACTTNEPVTPAPAPVVISPAPPPAVIAAPTAPPGSTVAVVPGTVAGQTVVIPPAPGPLRAGVGTVDSINAVPAVSGAGSTVPSDMRRVGVRMADGSIQYVDGRVPNLSLRDRVEITTDGRLRYPAP